MESTKSLRVTRLRESSLRNSRTCKPQRLGITARPTKAPPGTANRGRSITDSLLKASANELQEYYSRRQRRVRKPDCVFKTAYKGFHVSLYDVSEKALGNARERLGLTSLQSRRLGKCKHGLGSPRVGTAAPAVPCQTIHTRWERPGNHLTVKTERNGWVLPSLFPLR